MSEPSAFASPHDPQLSAAPPPGSAPPPPAQDYGVPDDDEGPGGKRKRNGDGGAGSRSKRSRYISIACNECKRRKIKCNGEVPCQRCGNLGLECVYAPNCCTSNFRDTTEYKQMQQHIYSLQDQYDGLWHAVNHMRALLPHADIAMPPAPAPRLLDLLSAYDRMSSPPTGGAGGGPQTTAPDAPPPPAFVNIDPTLGPHARKGSDAAHAHTHPHAHLEHQHDHDHDNVHHAHAPSHGPPPLGQHTHHASQPHAPPQPQRYAPAPARDPSSQLSYELARASMESMGIAAAGAGGVGGRPHGDSTGQAAADDADAAAVAAAAAAAAASAGGERTEHEHGQEQGTTEHSKGGGDGPEPDHQRALAELLHNAELQQQLQHGSGQGHSGRADDVKTDHGS